MDPDPSMVGSDQHIVRINLCGMEALAFIELRWLPFDRKRAVTRANQNRCVMGLVSELRQMWWLMDFMRQWLECYLGAHSRTEWSSIQIWLKTSCGSNNKALLTFDWSAAVRTCRDTYFGRRSRLAGEL